MLEQSRTDELPDLFWQVLEAQRTFGPVPASHRVGDGENEDTGQNRIHPPIDFSGGDALSDYLAEYRLVAIAGGDHHPVRRPAQRLGFVEEGAGLVAMIEDDLK